MKKVAIIMGSDSDLPVVERGREDPGRIWRGERSACVFRPSARPWKPAPLRKTPGKRAYGVIIAAAGKAAHLAGALAAGCTLPVIGIPVKSSLDGMDALLSTVQMPSGIPVATVAIDGAVNAALLAVEMLAITDDDLAEKLNSARRAAAEKVLRADAEVARKLRERKEA